MEDDKVKEINLHNVIASIVSNMNNGQVKFLYDTYNLVLDLLHKATPNIYINDTETKAVYYEFLNAKLTLIKVIYEQNRMDCIDCNR